MKNLFNKKPFIIAEIGQAHEGSIGIAHSYIDALSETGVNAIKFQTHIAEAESSPEEKFRTEFSYEDKCRMDYWKRMEFAFDQWVELKKHCELQNLYFISSPFSIAAVELLTKIDVDAFKVGSGEVRNDLLLKKIADTSKPVIISSGMSSFNDLDDAVSIFTNDESEIGILQCTTSYPTTPKEWGLNVITELKKKYKDLLIGYSDHSGSIYACLAAAALGSKIFEFHVVFDKMMFGPDSSSSLTIKEVKQVVEGVTKIDESLNNKINKNDLSKFRSLKNLFEKTLSVNRNVKAGDTIKEEMLETKKPKDCGIQASEYKTIIGKKFSRNMKKWDFIKKTDIV